jgi:hypothetical protein
MTPKPDQTFIFFHVRPHWMRAKKVSFCPYLPMNMGLWLGAESNRRHVDFQSNCSTTARLQCIIDSKYFIGELTSGDRRMHQTGRQNGNSEAPTVLPPDTEISVVF